MLFAYTSYNNSLRKLQIDDRLAIPEDAVWIDLFEPTQEEESAVENFLRVDIPTREEMNEIEMSNRFYQEYNATYMTVTLLAKADSDPQTHAVTFVMTNRKLITIRYVHLQTFDVFAIRSERPVANIHFAGDVVFIGLLEAIITRLADIIEELGHNIDKLSHKILRQRPKDADRPDFQEILEQIGSSGDLISKTRESMVSIMRLLSFTANVNMDKSEDLKQRLGMAGTDIAALSDHATFLSNKINFLLDATLGMINIEQNNIIKIFSVASVVFLPPTLIASIYGMNFQHMPELEWMIGYPWALGLMIASAILPYSFFKQRKWM
jgi:magnesium transporter